MSATPVDRVQALMAKFEDLAVEAGKSAIAIFENIDGGSPEAMSLKQGYNRAFTALESALRSELAGKDAERLQSAADAPKVWVLEFGAVTLPLGHPSRITSFRIFDNWNDAADALVACEFSCRTFSVDIPMAGIPEIAAIESTKDAK